MNREIKAALIQRSLGIRHKLKVFDSMKQPETHEDLAVSLLARWELEDELRAIDELLGSARNINVAEKRKMLETDFVKTKAAKKYKSSKGR